MTALIVFLQKVQAEVAVQVAPNGVNMIGVILRVVELNQETGRLDAIVMALSWLLATGPREIEIVPGLLDLIFARLIDLVGHILAIFVEQALKNRALRFGHLGGHQTTRLTVQRGFARRFGNDFLRRILTDDGGFLLVGGERLHELAAKVLLTRENPE